MSKIKLCIFDLDGTVVHSIPSIAYYVNETLNRYGYPSIPQEKYLRFIGNGARLLIRRALREVGGKEEEVESVLADYNAAYDRDPLHLAAPFNGIIPMLTALKAKGIKVAILSNKPDSTLQLIARHYFADDLVDLCFGAKVDEDLKPNPKMTRHIMKQLDAAPEETLVIGDSPVDIRTADNAGACPVAVTWGYSSREDLVAAGAHHLVEEPKQILSLIIEELL